jgi:hypothetical protein
MLGVKTAYVVNATWPCSNGQFLKLTYTCEIIPWLHSENFKELVENTQKQTKQDGAIPNITSTTHMD